VSDSDITSSMSWEATSVSAGRGDTLGVERRHNSPMLSAVYGGLLLFCIVYFFRPGDFILALNWLHLALVTGGFAVVITAIAALSGAIKLRREGKVLVALFAYLCLCIPFSKWRGGSFDLVVITFSKGVMIAIAVMVAVTTIRRLRWLMVVQALAMFTMAALAVAQPKRMDRMYGVGYLFSDPNDFALNLCVVLPFCLAFLLSSRRVLGKLVWTGVIGLMLFAIISTGSRGGFIALLAAMLAIWHRFRVKTSTAIVTVLLLTVLAGTAILLVGAHSYFERMSTIVDIQSDPNGSAMARRELLIESLKLTLTHPIFGIGPGQFQNYGGAWHETHNAYTQLSSEAGIPALALYIMLLSSTFSNLRALAKLPRGSKLWYLATGLYCGMVAYMVGSFFLSTAYLLYPYLLMAYISAAARIAADPSFSTTGVMEPSKSRWGFQPAESDASKPSDTTSLQEVGTAIENQGNR